jgi:hypothetical protein
MNSEGAMAQSHTVSAGEVIGEMAVFFPQGRRTASIVTQSETSCVATLHFCDLMACNKQVKPTKSVGTSAVPSVESKA